MGLESWCGDLGVGSWLALTSTYSGTMGWGGGWSRGVVTLVLDHGWPSLVHTVEPWAGGGAGVVVW